MLESVSHVGATSMPEDLLPPSMLLYTLHTIRRAMRTQFYDFVGTTAPSPAALSILNSPPTWQPMPRTDVHSVASPT